MKVNDFINKLKRLANDTPTQYRGGGVGQHEGKTFLFDCGGLIKSIIWGFNFDYSQYRGGAIYQSNGLPDVGCDRLFNEYCYDKSTDFTKIEVGELVWMSGHIGVYVGDRKVIEATSAWDNKVLISEVGNNGERTKNGSRCLTWTHHGKFNKIEYNQILKYRSHVESIGWQEYVPIGRMSGTTGESKRIEAIQFDTNEEIYAKAHIQDIGWVDYGKIDNNTIIGTTGKSKRLECLCLKGNFKWRAHLEGTGWTCWTLADGICTLGSVGQSLRVEAIQIEKI